MKKVLRPNDAFTIIELVIVVVVIAVLVTIVIVGYGAVQNNAQDSSLKADLSKIDDAFKLYSLDNGGVFPDTTTKLAALGLKINKDPYYTGNAANLYLCENAGRTEYAFVAMSRSGKRFQLKSEIGITDYTGGVTWDASTANWDTTCSSVDSTYVSPSHITGMVNTVWQTWAGVATITNLATNPSFETDLNNITSTSVNISSSSSWAADGTYSVQLDPQDPASNDSYISLGGDTGALRLGMQAGKTYTISATVDLSAAQTGTLSAYARSIYVSSRIGAGSYTTVVSSQPANVAGATRLSATFTLPTGTTEAFIRLYDGAFDSSGTVYWDGIMLTEGSSTYTYADGSKAGWAWNGTTNDSTSYGPTL